MAPEVQKPSQWLCLTKLPREMYSQPIVHKALSWGIIRKAAGILAEITYRKSQIQILALITGSAALHPLSLSQCSSRRTEGSRWELD